MTAVAATTPFDNGSDDVSIGVDASGGIHVAFRGIENASCCNQERGIGYAYYNGSSWTIQKVDSYVPGTNFSPGTDQPILRLDKSGNPHIVAEYRNSANPATEGGVTYNRYYSVKYYTRSGSTWSGQVASFQGNNSNELDDISFDLDTNDRPHIAYAAEKNGSGRDAGLYYTYMNSGGSFVSEITLLTGATGAAEALQTDIQIDPTNNYVHILSYNYNSVIRMSSNTGSRNFVLHGSGK